MYFLSQASGDPPLLMQSEIFLPFEGVENEDGEEGVGTLLQPTVNTEMAISKVNKLNIRIVVSLLEKI